MQKKNPVLFHIIKGLVKFFYGKTEVIGMENLPERDAVLVGNHAQMNGPIVGELFLPENCYTWCAGEMMNRKEVPEYAFRDFWSQKPQWTHPFYKVLSHVIAPLADYLFNHARTIPVYRDMRIMTTFRTSIQYLKEGANLLIFPEKDVKYNHILYQFQENFVDVAMLYYKKTGISLTFVPFYLAPRMRKLYIGKGIVFNAENPIEEERKRITAYLAAEITEMAQNLPQHVVVPYRNIPKKYYLTNQDIGEVPNEKARR